MTQLDYAWAAGLFDGEGCICIERFRPGTKCGERSVKFRFRIRVNMTSRTPVEELRKVFGYGSVCSYERKDGRNRMYTWSCEGERAALAVTKMMPYFRLKRAEAELGLNFMEFQRASIPVSLGCKGASYETLQKRQVFYMQMLELKVCKKRAFKPKPLPEFEELHRIRANGINQQPLRSLAVLLVTCGFTCSTLPFLT